MKLVTNCPYKIGDIIFMESGDPNNIYKGTLWDQLPDGLIRSGSPVGQIVGSDVSNSNVGVHRHETDLHNHPPTYIASIYSWDRTDYAVSEGGPYLLVMRNSPLPLNLSYVGINMYSAGGGSSVNNIPMSYNVLGYVRVG